MWRFLLLLFLASSCCNRTVSGLRQGYWKEKDSISGALYVSKGRYRNDFQKGKWRYKKDGKLVKKESYKGEDCHVMLYDEAGNKIREGYTKLILADSLAHWFYHGPWKNYDRNGNLISTDLYHEGALLEPMDSLPLTNPN